MRILFIVRKYFPDISASGNLIKPLVETMSLDNTVDVLCLGETTQKEIVNEISVIRIRKKANHQLNIIDKINRKINFNYFDTSIYLSIIDVLNDTLKNDYDKFIAVTYEEALALKNSSIEQEKKCILLLEKIPYVNKIKKILFKEKIIENQTNFFSSYNKIFCLNDVIEELSEYIPLSITNRIVSIKHPMIKKVNIDLIRENNNIDDSTIRFLYGGGLDKVQRNPEKIVQIINMMAQRRKVLFEIFSYGNYQKKLTKIKKYYDFLRISPPINSDQFKIKMVNSDFLISIGNKETDIIPSKIFDYISSQKPIIHFAQTDDDKYFKILKNYPYAIVLNINRLEDAKKELLDFIDNYKDKQIPFEFIKNIFKDYTPEYVSEKIYKSLIEEKRNE
ncbi:glycosyltransferase family protein [Enterococcus faecium]|uniref:hypothetical protein n=1 Tax=Enterococcus faecium TaxID=1352 RepID=UPI0002A32D75|nr:hypothetical protein [Enterococcus faecium]ELA97848.1 hypothetical protein OIA_02875 [Enterococcus faecium EnGen0018]